MSAQKKTLFDIFAMSELAELLHCMIFSKITKRDSMFKLILGLGGAQFWQELKASGFDTEELISAPFQDGYGIGLVNWAGGEGAA